MIICTKKNHEINNLEFYANKAQTLIDSVVESTVALSNLDEADKDDEDTRLIVNLMRSNNIKHNNEIEVWREKAKFAAQHIEAYKSDQLKVRICAFGCFSSIVINYNFLK